LIGGKNLARKTFVSSSLEAMDPGGKEWSHILALSLSKSENRRRWIASMEAPLIFNVSYTSRRPRGAGWDPPLVCSQIRIVVP